MKINANDPINRIDYNYHDEYGRLHREKDNIGLTKREYFAAMAMQGLLAGNYKEIASNVGIPAKTKVLQYAIQYADALITELNTTTK